MTAEETFSAEAEEAAGSSGRSAAESYGPALSWSIKESFRAYMKGVGGTIELVAPAKIVGTQYLFPMSAVKIPAKQTVCTFAGAVRCRAHEGLMQVLLADPWIHFDGPGRGRLSVAAEPHHRLPENRLPIADLTFPEPAESGGLLCWDGAGARLAASGAATFDFNYAPGTELSAVSFSWPAASPRHGIPGM